MLSHLIKFLYYYYFFPTDFPLFFLEFLPETGNGWLIFIFHVLRSLNWVETNVKKGRFLKTSCSWALTLPSIVVRTIQNTTYFFRLPLFWRCHLSCIYLEYEARHIFTTQNTTVNKIDDLFTLVYRLQDQFETFKALFTNPRKIKLKS